MKIRVAEMLFLSCLLILLLAACGRKRTETPDLTPSTPLPAATMTPSRTPAQEEPTRTGTIGPVLINPSTRTPAPTQSGTAALPDLLRTRAAGVDETATAYALAATPTPNLSSAPPLALTLHPQALNAANAGQIRLLRQIGAGQISGLAWSPDGRYLAVRTSVGVRILDGATLSTLRQIELGAAAVKAVFAPDGQHLAVAYEPVDRARRQGLVVEVWGAASGQRLVEMTGSFLDDVGFNLLFAGENELIGFGFWSDGSGRSSQAMQIVTWDASSGSVANHSVMGRYETLDLHAGTRAVLINAFPMEVHLLDSNISVALRVVFEDAVFSPRGTEVIGVEAGSQNLLSYNLADGSTQRSSQIQCTQVLRSGQKILCVNDGNVGLVDPLTLTESVVYDLPDGVTSLAADETGQLAWLKDGQVGGMVRGANGNLSYRQAAWERVGAAAAGVLLVDHRQVSVAAGDVGGGVVKVWDLESGLEIASLYGSGSQVEAIAFSSDRRRLAWVDARQDLYLWDVIEQRQIYRYHLTQPVGNWLVFNPQNTRVYLPDLNDNLVYQMDLRSGALEPWFSPDEVPGFLDEEETILVINLGLVVYLPPLPVERINHVRYISDLGSGVLPVDFELDTGNPKLYLAAISPGQRFLAVSSVSSEVMVYDLEQEQSIYRLRGGYPISGFDLWDGWASSLNLLAFNPGEDLLVTVKPNGAGELWGLADGSLLGRRALGRQVFFTPDGRYLVGAWNGLIRVWGLP